MCHCHLPVGTISLLQYGGTCVLRLHLLRLHSPHWGTGENGWGWETSLLCFSPSWSAFSSFSSCSCIIFCSVTPWGMKNSQGLSATFFHPVFSSFIQQSSCIAAKEREEAQFGSVETPCLAFSVFSGSHTWRFIYGIVLTELLSIPVLESKTSSFCYVCL